MQLWELPIWPSAFKHGIATSDIRHALRNFMAIADEDEGVTLFFGPTASGGLVEIGVLDTDEGPVVIHAMAARTQRFHPPKE